MTVTSCQSSSSSFLPQSVVGGRAFTAGPVSEISKKKKDETMSKENSITFIKEMQKVSKLPEQVQTILDIGFKNKSKIVTINLQSCNITNEMMPELCEWLIKLGDKVKVLNLPKNKIGTNGATVLFDKLRESNSSIKKINLANNLEINDLSMKSLGEYLKSNKNIEEIWLDSCKVSDTDIALLAHYLDGNKTFKHLSLHRNKGITDKSIPLLVKIIDSSHIEDIYLNDTLVTQKNAIIAPSTCKRIKHGANLFDVYQTDLNDDDLIKICNCMKKYGVEKLREIYLHGNNLTSKGASELFNTLRQCNSVATTIDLSENKVDDECMKQLGEYLQKNGSLVTLLIGDNKITDKGIEILSTYTAGNKKLKELDLSWNDGITDASAPYLLDLSRKSWIGAIALMGSSISNEKQKEIQESLQVPIEQRNIPTKSIEKISSALA